MSDDIRAEFVRVKDAFVAFAVALGDACRAVTAILTKVDPTKTYIRYAVEHMDIAESDIKRIDFSGPDPVVVLKNWRRIPIGDR